MIYDIPTISFTMGLSDSGSVVVRPRLTIKRIQEVVADYYDIPAIDMISARRNRSSARPRQIAMYLARQLTPKSLPDIGGRFGGRDHTTVMHAIGAVQRHMRSDPEIASAVKALRERLAA